MVEVILWALEQRPPTGLFNVGTGQATPFKDLIEALFAAANRDPRVAYIPMPETLWGNTNISPRPRLPICMLRDYVGRSCPCARSSRPTSAILRAKIAIDSRRRAPGTPRWPWPTSSGPHWSAASCASRAGSPSLSPSRSGRPWP